MEQKKSHSIFSIILAGLVLLSTVSFTMEKHFCGDVLIDSSLFAQVDSCVSDANAVALSVKKMSCCKDVVEIVKGQEQLKKASFDDLLVDQQVFLRTFLYSYSNLFKDFPKQVIPHKNYSPPNLIVDMIVFNQVFLI